MKLSDVKFETNYNSYDFDLIKDFYIKALSVSTYYDRVSAFFDSKILALYSRGLEKIYKNGGKIRFIFSQQLEEKDYIQMLDGYRERSEQLLLNQFERAELTEADKIYLSNLAFLIKKSVIDIKIAFTKSGILHDKFGLIYDENNNYLYFRGSNNETVAAIEANHESFEVSCSWYSEAGENSKIAMAKETFEKMWNDCMQGMKVVEIPNTVRQEIMKYNDGKITLEEDIEYKNVVLADLTNNNEYIVYNKLDRDYNFLQDYDYKTTIKYHVKKYENRTIYFNNNISYITMQKLNEAFNKSSCYNNYEFVVSGRLSDYIRNKNYQIETRKELGKMIKKKDSSVYQAYTKFSTIVHNEMQRKLREKQMWDAFFIVQMVKSANYSVPGAGKTSIVYGAFSYLNSSEKNLVDKLIVIGPKNSFKSWKDEFFECFGSKKELKLLNIQDKKYKSTESKIYDLKYDSFNDNVILVNYDMLSSLKDALKEIINDKTMLVFDEVHKVKSVNGIWSNAALEISKNAKYKVILTGTPIPNSYVDLYSQLNILFTDEYKTFFKLTPKELSKSSDDLTRKINELIYPFFCRTTKRDLNIPLPNQDIKIITPMSSDEEKLFSIVHRKYSNNGLLLIIRLMQASSNPKLLLKKLDYNDFKSLLTSEEEENFDEFELEFNESNAKDTHNLNYDEDERVLINKIDMTSKFWSGIELIEKLVNESKSVIVWGIFVDTIDRIEKELSNKGIKCKKIYGLTELEQRESIIDSFKKKEFDVLITNPHTMAESVSLHTICHDAVYFEYSFNLTHMLQSKDRINRLGLPQNQYTQYYYLFLCDSDGFNDSADLKIYDRLKEKEEIMIKSIEGELIESIDFKLIDDVKRILDRT